MQLILLNPSPVLKFATDFNALKLVFPSAIHHPHTSLPYTYKTSTPAFYFRSWLENSWDEIDFESSFCTVPFFWTGAHPRHSKPKWDSHVHGWGVCSLSSLLVTVQSQKFFLIFYLNLSSFNIGLSLHSFWLGMRYTNPQRLKKILKCPPGNTDALPISPGLCNYRSHTFCY